MLSPLFPAEPGPAVLRRDRCSGFRRARWSRPANGVRRPLERTELTVAPWPGAAFLAAASQRLPAAVRQVAARNFGDPTGCNALRHRLASYASEMSHRCTAYFKTRIS